MDDYDNFQFELDGRKYTMSDGELTVNNVSYEDNEDDPTYSLVRAYWRLARSAGAL